MTRFMVSVRPVSHAASRLEGPCTNTCTPTTLTEFSGSHQNKINSPVSPNNQNLWHLEGRSLGSETNTPGNCIYPYCCRAGEILASKMTVFDVAITLVKE